MLLAALALAASPTPSLQSAPDAAFSACLVRNIASEDRITLVRWTFAMYSAHDRVKDLSTVTPAQRDALSKEAGAIMNRLLLQDCRTEAVTALARPDSSPDAVLEKAFGELGESAAGGLMEDPKVQRAMLGLLEGVNIRGWSEMMLDAGVDPTTGKRKARK